MRGRKRVTEGIKEFGGYVGDFQARLVLTILYFTLVAPFSLVVKLVVKPLRGSGYAARQDASSRQDLSAGRQQY